MPNSNRLSRRTLLKQILAGGAALSPLAVGGVACTPAATRAARDVAGGSVQSTSTALLAFLVSVDPVEEAAYRALLDTFHAASETATVDLVNLPTLPDLYRRVLTDFAAGTPADLLQLGHLRFAAFAAKQMLADLQPYLDGSTVVTVADFYPQALAAFRWQSQLLGIARDISPLVLYYNKQLFDTAGVAYPAAEWTWADCVETAQLLTRDNDGDGIVDVWGLGTDALTMRVAPFIWMNGGDLVDNPQQPTQLTLDSPPTHQALAWFVGLQTVHGVVPDPITEKAESHEARFVNGRLAMYLESRRVTPSLRLNTTFDWDVAPLPRGNTPATIMHGDGFCMVAQSRAKAAAWSLIEHASSPAGQQLLSATGRIVPTRHHPTVVEAFLNPAANPLSNQVFLDGLAYMHRLPLMPTWSDIEIGISRELEVAFHGDSTLDAAIDAATIRTLEFFPHA